MKKEREGTKMTEKVKKVYEEDFKKHIVSLNTKGQSISEIAKEYGLHKTSVSNWIRFYKNSGSFKSKDNMSEQQNRIRELERQTKEQQMEIDILKKAMVVMLKH